MRPLPHIHSKKHLGVISCKAFLRKTPYMERSSSDSAVLHMVAYYCGFLPTLPHHFLHFSVSPLAPPPPHPAVSGKEQCVSSATLIQLASTDASCFNNPLQCTQTLRFERRGGAGDRMSDRGRDKGEEKGKSKREERQNGEEV